MTKNDPLFKAFTVGFDEMFNRVQSLNTDYYNIVKLDENKYRVEVAVAGFCKNELEVEVKENTLVLSGKSKTDESENFVHKGIANRAFKRSFELADTVEVQSSELTNGMLKVFLENIIPESRKPKKVDITEPVPEKE
jgi:molecular chaperone IbpA